MKNAHVFLFALLINFGLQSMEQAKDTLPDWRHAHSVVKALAKFEIKLCLENHDTTGAGDIFDKSVWATGSEATAREAMLEHREGEEDNTIAHLLIIHKNPNNLFICALKDAISLEKNKQGKTAFDLAHENFLTHLKENISGHFKDKNFCLPKNMSEERCCFMILSNYIRSKSEGCAYRSFYSCCFDHRVGK